VFSRNQLKRAASLTEEDFVQLAKCRRPHNRLGFAYQVAFVRLFDRFPQQQPFELLEEIFCFSAAQLEACLKRDRGGVRDGSERAFLDSPKAEWLWEFAEANDIVVHIHPPMLSVGPEVLMQYRLNEAAGCPGRRPSETVPSPRASRPAREVL
jgi:hypothetical protein